MNLQASAPFERMLPALNDLNRPFWTGGKDGQLLICRCTACERWIHPPQPICPVCLQWHPVPTPISGAGRILSFTVNHQPWHPNLPVPYVIAVVELQEQPDLRVMTNIIGCDPQQVAIGQAVQVCFEQHDDVWLPLFRTAP